MVDGVLKVKQAINACRIVSLLASCKNRGIFQTCLLMFKALNCEAPEYLNVFNNVQNANYVLRSNDQSVLEVPKAKTETFKKSFSYSGAALWNSLPQNI